MIFSEIGAGNPGGGNPDEKLGPIVGGKTSLHNAKGRAVMALPFAGKFNVKQSVIKPSSLSFSATRSDR